MDHSWSEGSATETLICFGQTRQTLSSAAFVGGLVVGQSTLPHRHHHHHRHYHRHHLSALLVGLLSLCWWQELCRLNKQYSHVHTWLEFIYFCDLTQNHKWWQHCSFRWGVDLLFFFFLNTKAIFTNRLTLLNHGKECSLNSADCCSAVFIYQDAVVVTTFYLPPGPVLLSLANRASTASSSAPWVFRASELTVQLKPISWNHTNIQTLKPQMITLLAQHIHTHTHTPTGDTGVSQKELFI